MDECEEVFGSSVVSSGEAPEVLELVEASLDAVAEPVDGRVVGDGDLAGACRGDDGFGVHGCDGLAQVVVVIGPVGQHGLRLEAFEQGLCGQVVVPLAGSEHEAQRPAERVADHVDLGGQTTSGTPQRLSFGPPFPAAAC